MDWDNIDYVFQIPKEWYKNIHDQVNNAYGTDFLTLTDGKYGGVCFGIDWDRFADSVNTVVSSDTLSGYVKTVNNIEPDENGNVDLDSDYLEASDITAPGEVVGTDYAGEETVCSPNHKHKVKDVEGAVKSVNGNGPDADGNVEVEVEGGVKTVNDIEPDEDGNVDLGQLVYTVNSHEPDEDGNIEFDIVESVDGVAPVAGNVPLGAIRSIDNNIRPVNGNVNLFDYYSPEGHTHTHTEISDWDNATKDFLEASDITTPGIVVGTDYAGDKTVCSPNHKHNAKDIVNSDTDGFVTIDTQQTVTGQKYFTQDVNVMKTDNSSGVQLDIDGQIRARGGTTSVAFFLPNSSTDGMHLAYENGHGQLAIRNGTLQIGTMAQGNDDAVQLIAPQNKALLLTSPSTDGTAPDNAIATVGWVKEKALTVPDGKTPKTQNVTLVSNVTWNGTQIVIQKQTLEFSNGVLTNVTNATNGTINTVAYSPS